MKIAISHWSVFLTKRILILCFSLFLVASVTFFLMHNIPGDPFTQDAVIPEEILASMRKFYGLDDPWYVQYGRYLKNILTWNLGPSFKYEARTVNEIIAEGFPASLQLGLQAISVSMVLGILLGSFSALKKSRWQDRFFLILIAVGTSIPSFILATLFQFIFAMKLEWFPVARWGSFAQTILPTLALSAFPTAFIAKMLRTTMGEVLEQDYILTAKVKGLSSFHILFKHVIRNAILPIITYLGPLTASVITGSFIVEKIFAIPGLGGWFVSSVINRDYTAIMGVTIFYSSLLMICVLIVDVLYSLIDPRIEIDAKKLARRS